MLFDERDKQKHMAVSAGGTVLFYEAAKAGSKKPLPTWAPWVAGAVFVTGASVAKELFIDNRGDARDVVANMIGASLGSLVCITF